MRALVQRVSRAEVSIRGKVTASIGKGYLILLGVRRGDMPADADFLAAKCAGLRVMEDAGGKMNLSLVEAGGKTIVVSQFTLYADAQRGNRPSFSDAAPPGEAEPLYERFVGRMRALLGGDAVQTGLFGAMMEVMLVNDGPVTVIVESPASPAGSQET